MPPADGGGALWLDAALEHDAADALPGTYAVHVRFYGRERSTGLIELLHELISVATITGGDAALHMQVRTCEDSGHLVSAGLRTDVRVKYPEQFPVRDFELVVEGESFHSTGEPLAIGYEPQWPDGCTAGASLPSASPWLQGSCACIAGSDPPTRADDCRVIDSDQDGNPGMTVQASGLVNALQSARIRDRSQYVLGVIDQVTRRHRASYDKAEDFRELVCSAGDCPSYEGRLCEIGQQRVTFVPLAEPGSSCAEVLQRVERNELFSGEGLDGSFPAGC